MTRTLTATIWREEEGYVSLCPELDIASQGDTVEEARAVPPGAGRPLLRGGRPPEVAERLKPELYVTSLEVNVGEAA